MSVKVYVYEYTSTCCNLPVVDILDKAALTTQDTKSCRVDIIMPIGLETRAQQTGKCVSAETGPALGAQLHRQSQGRPFMSEKIMTSAGGCTCSCTETNMAKLAAACVQVQAALHAWDLHTQASWPALHRLKADNCLMQSSWSTCVPQ